MTGINFQTAFIVGAALHHHRNSSSSRRVSEEDSEPEYGGLEELCDAAKDGGILAVKTILSRDYNRVDVNEACPAYKCTAMFLAAQEGHEKIISLLADNGAKVDNGGDDEGGRSPLWMAALNGHLLAVQTLVTCRANLEHTNSKTKDTPLARAASKGHTPVVNYLLQAKANPECLDSDGDTPLISAIFANKPEVVSALVAAHANVKQTRKDGFSPLAVAVQKNHLEVAAILLEAGAPVALKQAGKRVSPLHSAATFGFIEMARLLLKHHADINHLDDQGFSPLFWAVEGKQMGMATFLIESKADLNPDLRASNNFSPLMKAAATGQYDMCALLLDNKAEVDLSNRPGNTALRVAAANNHPMVVSLLLLRGASTKYAKLEHSVLFIAIDKDLPEIVKMLHARGKIDINQPFGDTTPLSYALNHNKSKCAALLISLGAQGGQEGTTPLHHAAASGNEEILRQLLTEKPNLEATDVLGNTPLLSAATHGTVNSMRILIDHGASLVHQNKFGEDAFWLCCFSGVLLGVDLLLQHGFDTTKQKSAYKTLEPKHRQLTRAERKQFENAIKYNAIELVTQALNDYETAANARKMAKDASREKLVTLIKDKMDAYKKDDFYQAGHIIALVRYAQKVIVEKKLHGIRGATHSKLSQGLENSVLHFNQLFTHIENTFLGSSIIILNVVQDVSLKGLFDQIPVTKTNPNTLFKYLGGGYD